MSKDYYPPVASRLQTVNSQIEEFQKLVYRNDLELRVAKETDDSAKKMETEVEFNNNIAKAKLDVFYKVRDELQTELGILKD